MRKTSLLIALMAASIVGAGMSQKTAAQEIGEAAPRIACADWVNADANALPSLENLKGKVVLLEFWFST